MAKHRLIAWKEYDLPDNGLYGPKGSNPKFCPVHNTPLSLNSAIGYVEHDEHKPDDVIRRRKILINELKLVNKELRNDNG